jgi:hypothetical protein
MPPLEAALAAVDSTAVDFTAVDFMEDSAEAAGGVLRSARSV